MGKGLASPPPPPPFSDIETGSIEKPHHHHHHHHRHHHRHHRSRPPPPPPPPPPEPWFAWLLPLIFVADIAIFVFTMYVNDCPGTYGSDHCLYYEYLGRFSFQKINDNPLLGPSIYTLKRLGALEWNLVVEGRQTWRLISCMWLHAGVIHLLANMLSLIFMGFRLEKEFGFWRIGLIYMISGFGGSLKSAIAHCHDETISVGASGALFGLLGAMLSELMTNWTSYTNKCGALSTMLLIICLNLAFGFLPHVDNSAHVGGFVSGFLAGFIFLMRPQFGYVSSRHVPPGYEIKHKIPKHKLYQYVFLVLASVLLIIGYAVGLNRLFEGQSF